MIGLQFDASPSEYCLGSIAPVGSFLPLLRLRRNVQEFGHVMDLIDSRVFIARTPTGHEVQIDPC
ncbi:hypothetical protein BJL96_27550 [Burkholderia cenocepacia]|nr:hypothetical protein [Burkholderia cenocepacia]